MNKHRHPGRLITNGVLLERHEVSTVNFLLSYCNIIELIPPSNIENVKTPDVMVDGVVREMKSPSGRSRHTLERSLKSALRQSQNIIIDLRRIKLPASYCNEAIKREFNHNKSIQELWVITKEGKLLDFKRK